ncbi:VOC family protein [Halioglobus maricola]|uniref:VOC family protein n=1 Tax=Halioglobus maricola TaxID=2601894 RepID=A0A5P9NJL4_9GAMM|nr:VOC family protein [Halioglobus maricola]QFU75414.1 VOC family protein [Halioglobus maricola]
MSQPNALHHIAISTGDIKKQIEFFSDVLGMELVALYWMHGAEGAWHGFMRLGNEAVAFVFLPENAELENKIGYTHPGHGAGGSAPGTLQHLSLNVDTREDMLALQNRIRSRGVPVMGPIHHGFCSSIYFAGPENLTLEISTNDGANAPLDLDGTWIDQEVVKLAGISADELERYRNPAAYEAPAESVPQPAYDTSKPMFALPEEMLQAMLQAPDEAITEAVSDTVPPGK